MQVSVEVKDGLQRRMVVQVPQDRVDSEIDTRIKTLAGQVRLDGFRPGKVPLSVVKQRFGGQVRDEVMGELIRTTFEEAIAQEQLKPVSSPNIEPLDVDKAEGLNYAATFEVFPEQDLDEFSAVKVVKPVVDVTDSDVDEMIETLRKQRVNWSSVERSAVDGDRLTIDFKGSVDGELFAGGEATDFDLVLGSNAMIPGFESQLSGVSAGDKPTIEVVFPDNYQADALQGKQASFEIEVKVVSEPELPAIDDEFFKIFGVEEGGESAFRGEIKANMERELAQRVRARVKAQVMDGVLKVSKSEAPQSMVADETKTLAGHRQQANMPEISAEELAKEAERRVRLGMILSEVVNQEKLSVEPESVRKLVEQLAEAYEDPAEVVQFYYSNREKLAEVESMVVEDLFVDWVLGKCSVEENPQSFAEMMNPAST
ncbi:MAG TPA: trigger factor [Chromatiaceae bacterium]|nr:trigger factor [Chromatiaceae bacterium]